MVLEGGREGGREEGGKEGGRREGGRKGGRGEVKPVNSCRLTSQFYMFLCQFKDNCVK